MSNVTSLQAAIDNGVSDSDSVYLAGFTHLIPFAAGHEMIRQEKRDLELIRATPDLVYDQLIAAGCARKVTFSWAGNPGVGSLPAFRRAAEEGIPNELELEEYTHFGLIAALDAGASNLPFAPLRGFIGSDLPDHNDNIARIESPFDDDYVYAVAPIEPDVAVIRAQRADEAGNAHLWGIQGEVKIAGLAADTVILSVEELCSEETIRSDPNRTVITSDDVDYVVHDPYGSHPSYAQGYYGRDNEAYIEWAEIANDVDRVKAWLDEWVYSVDNRREYVEKLGVDRLLDLNPDHAYATPVDRGQTDDRHPLERSRGCQDRPIDRIHGGNPMNYTKSELMVVTAARELENDDSVLVGIGKPNLACNVAKRTHAPDLQMVYESGTIGSNPSSPPLSIGDPVLASGAVAIEPMVNGFNYYLQAGRLDVGFLGGAQIDKYGNINSTVIGDYDDPDVRLPGSGGACEIAGHVDRTLMITPHSERRFPEEVDFITSPGYVDGREGRAELELSGGPDAVITDLAVCRFDERGEMYVDALHPSATREEVRAETGWVIEFADELGTTPEPTAEELRLIRDELDPDEMYTDQAE